jgi:outer membrane protein assembly factor BamB
MKKTLATSVLIFQLICINSQWSSELLILNGFYNLPDTTYLKCPFAGKDTSGYTGLDYSIEQIDTNHALVMDWKLRAYDTLGGVTGCFYVCDDPAGYYDFSNFEFIEFSERVLSMSTNPGAVEFQFVLCDGGGKTNEPWDDSEIWISSHQILDGQGWWTIRFIDLTGESGDCWNSTYMGRSNNGDLDLDSIRAWGLLFSISGNYFEQENDTAEGSFAVDEIFLLNMYYIPQAQSDWIEINSAEPVEIDILGNDLDEDGDLDPSSVIITQAPQYGRILSVNPGNGVVTYHARQYGEDWFLYSVSDSGGHQSVEAGVYIMVPWEANIPVTYPDIQTIDENQPIDIYVTSNDDFNILRNSSLTIHTDPLHGHITQIDTIGPFIQYTPDPGFAGRDSFEYVIADTNGHFSFPCNVDLYIGSSYSSFDRIFLNESEPFYAANAAGWIDIDNDNFPDLYSANWETQNTAYINQVDSSFSVLSIDTATYHIWTSRTVNAGDYDNDGFTDLFSLRRGTNRDKLLYRNKGDGSFEKITSGAIVEEIDTSAAASSWIDFNNDGFLDMFILRALKSPVLYLNDGHGSFTKQTNVIDANWPYNSRSFAWADYDLDGDQDIYIANWEEPGCLYQNNGNGTFSRVENAPALEAYRSNGCLWGDLDDDGYPDLMVTNNWNAPCLFRNRNLEGKGFEYVWFNFEMEVPRFNDGTDVSMIDIDNDGDLDVYVSFQNRFNNDLYLNPGNGQVELHEWTVGNIVSGDDNSAGHCWADYNRDGFLDLFVCAWWGDKSCLYRNQPNGNHWINIKLKGDVSNASAIGAKVRIAATIKGKRKWQTRVVDPKTGTHSSNSLNVHFGLGDAKVIDTILVDWPSGYKHILRGVPADQFLEIEEIPAEMAFHVKTNGSIEGGVTSLGSQAFYAPSTGDQVYRFDEQGNVIYTLKVNGNVKSSTTLTPDHTLYITSTDNNLYSFNANGVTNYGWPVAMGSEVTASVAVDISGNIYVGTENGIYQAICKEGRILWSYQVGEPVHASSVISASNRLYVINKAGRVYAFDLDSIDPGQVQYSWIYDLGEEVTSSPALDSASNIYITTLGGSLFKLNDLGSSAQVDWSFGTGIPVESSPILYDGRVIFGCLNGFIYAVDESTGTTSWTFNMKAPVKSTGAAGSGIIYFGSIYGDLAGLSSDDGSEVFRYYYDGSGINCPLLLQGDKLYYGTENGSIISLVVSGNKKSGISDQATSNNWPTFQGNNMRTGNLRDISTGTLQENLTGQGPVISHLANNPNPFREITEISFLLTIPSDLEITIFDGKGILIDRVEKQSYPTGYHAVKWNASQHPPGFYYYRVSNGEKSVTGKMSVIK